MPDFHCHCECSKCPPTALNSNTSLQSLNLRSLSESCRSVLVVGCPDNLKQLLEFSDCFRLCFKLAVSLQHCTSHWVCIRQILWPLVFVPVLCAARCVCWRAILLEDEFGGQPAIALKEQ